MWGWDVAALQFRLAWHGFPSGPLDGSFGPRVNAALLGYQTWRRIGADGVAGPMTVRTLYEPLPARAFASRGRSGCPSETASGPAGTGSTRGSICRPGGTRPCSPPAGGVWSWPAGRRGATGASWSISHGYGMTSYYAHLRRIARSGGPARPARHQGRPRRLERHLDRPAPAFRAAQARSRSRPATRPSLARASAPSPPGSR